MSSPSELAVTSSSPTADRIHWLEGAEPRSALWCSERGAPPPQRVLVVDDTLGADAAYRLACEGTALLWRGDHHNARQLLEAMARRVEQVPKRKARAGSAAAAKSAAPADTFHRHRQAQAQRARILSQLLVPLAGDYGIELRRAPEHRLAFTHAWGPADGNPRVVALRELLGIVGAYEWYKRGVPIPALGEGPNNRIHAHYGVFSPLRGEYVDLVAATPLPPGGDELAWEIGTGSGVLAAVLARRGVRRVVATERDARALACAADNVRRLGLGEQVELVAAELYPPGADLRSPLIVCNPPWIPARAGVPIERAIYDADCGMLQAFLAGLKAHLAPRGEGWLILSDIAEHLGLRTREQLLGWIEAAGLEVRGRADTRPIHRKATDKADPLHAARAAEITSLWQLGEKQ